jgi:hypothetical protein
VKRPRKLVALVGRDVNRQRVWGDLSVDMRHRGLVIVRDHFDLDRLRPLHAEDVIWLDWGASPMQKEFCKAHRLGDPSTIEQAREILHG